MSGREASAPIELFNCGQTPSDPGQGYCHFTHAQDSSRCTDSPNPADLGVRDADPKKNAWGGEYASFLLPSQYDEYADGRLTLYFVMSTWNPYQVVEMKTEFRRPVWWKRLLINESRLERWLP